MDEALVEEKDMEEAIDFGRAQSDLAVGKSLADSKGTTMIAEFSGGIGSAEDIARQITQ